LAKVVYLNSITSLQKRTRFPYYCATFNVASGRSGELQDIADKLVTALKEDGAVSAFGSVSSARNASDNGRAEQDVKIVVPRRNFDLSKCPNFTREIAGLVALRR
jgi:hypothetical protein